MPRFKQSGPQPGPRPTPRPGGNWLAGAMIGSTIMTMAAQAMLLGAAAAITDMTLTNKP